MNSKYAYAALEILVLLAREIEFWALYFWALLPENYSVLFELIILRFIFVNWRWERLSGSGAWGLSSPKEFLKYKKRGKIKGKMRDK